MCLIKSLVVTQCLPCCHIAQQYVSAWAESLDGLWQWQRLDFPMEQAFNSLVSKDGTKCCVCTLLAPDDTFKPLDRDKLMKLYKKYQK